MAKNKIERIDQEIAKTREKIAEQQEKLKALVENLLIWDKEEQFPARKEGCQWCPYRYFCPEGTGEPPAVDR